MGHSLFVVHGFVPSENIHGHQFSCLAWKADLDKVNHTQNELEIYLARAAWMIAFISLLR